MHRPALLLLLGLAVVLAGCGRPSSPDPVAELLPLRVQTAMVTSEHTPSTLPIPGTVRPAERATLASQVMGTVQEVHVTVGASVEAGDLLITLRADELAARVEQARAQLSHATREYEREAGLLSSGAATAESVRTLADQRQAATAALQETETMQGYTQIIAPFAGVVTGDFVRAGDLATPGAPLLQLEGLASLQVEAHVPETLPLLDLGANVLVEAAGDSASAQLVELSPAADPASRTRLAKLALAADAPFRSGQYVRVRWPRGEATQTTVPARAVSAFGQMERIFVIEDQRARLRLVRTGGSNDGRVTLLSGASAGEVVVLDPPATLRDGQRVETGR